MAAWPAFVLAIERLAETEGPIHLDAVKKRIAWANGKRLGSRTSRASGSLVAWAANSPRLKVKDAFLDHTEAPVTKVRVPAADPDSLRAPEHICLDEYRIAVNSILRSAGSMDEVALVSAVARAFGFQRTGTLVRKAIVGALERMRRSGEVELRNSRWVPLAPP